MASFTPIQKDLLQKHYDLKKRVLRLETSSLNGEPTRADLVPHTDDILEALYRGSKSRDSGGAKFGHVAAHLWEMEHDDPYTHGNVEFHRKMRLMRERVGCNPPLVDYLTAVSQTLQRPPMSGTIAILEHHVFLSHPPIEDYFLGSVVPSGGTPPSTHAAALGPIIQPIIMPGEPLGVGQNLGGDFLNTYTTERVFGEAFAIAGPDLYNEGGGMMGLSARWYPGSQADNGGPTNLFRATIFETALGPPTSLNGSEGVGNHSDGDFYGGQVFDDILIWCNWTGRSQSIAAGNSTRKRVRATPSPNGITGVFNDLWYSGLVRPFPEPLPAGAQIFVPFVPADWVQSPGPPIDFDPALPVAQVGGFRDPSQAGIQGNFTGYTVPNLKSLVPFGDTARANFNAALAEPQFQELINWWTANTNDFGNRGQPYNHGWKDLKSFAFTGPRYQNLQYLLRYNVCHLRGRIYLPPHQFSTSAFVFDMPIGTNDPANPLPVPLDPVTMFYGHYEGKAVKCELLNSGGPGGWGISLPEYGTDVGAGSTSGISYIDIDSWSYPY